MTPHDKAIVASFMEATDNYLRAIETARWHVAYSDDLARVETSLAAMRAARDTFEQAERVCGALVLGRD